MWDAFVRLIADALTLNNELLRSIGVPYSFGFAIILFTLIIKVLTLPLTFKQLQAARKMQELQPELQKLQKKYKDDREKLSKAQMELYKEAGVNPLGGCLPTLIQMPIWFALYRALFQLASEGNLKEGFFWIPSLAEPHDISWIWPLPQTPDGWLHAAALLVLPILTVVTQIIVQKMSTPQSSDQQQAMMSQMMMFMPIMFGFFALQVPQGLVLYWVTSNLFTLVQQYFINKQSEAAKIGKEGGAPATFTMTKAVEEATASTVTPATEVVKKTELAKRAKDGKRKSKR
ncbi:MAG: YidC/Oxa1 family membrane protein insertase [Anaerolineae bacterium]